MRLSVFHLCAENPSLETGEGKQDPDFAKRLTDVYVTSQDPIAAPKLKVPQRPLPQAREFSEPAELGYQEPVKVTKGRLSMRQALLMIGSHCQDPANNTASALAEVYTINTERAGELFFIQNLTMFV